MVNTKIIEYKIFRIQTKNWHILGFDLLQLIVISDLYLAISAIKFCIFDNNNFVIKFNFCFINIYQIFITSHGLLYYTTSIEVYVTCVTILKTKLDLMSESPTKSQLSKNHTKQCTLKETRYCSVVTLGYGSSRKYRI